MLAAGAWSAPLAARLGVDLPVRASKRDVFVLESPAATLAHWGFIQRPVTAAVARSTPFVGPLIITG